jgi:hypothetical protein
MADKERSPNYPAIGLGPAAEHARDVYRSEGRSAVPMEALAQALKHGSLSGPARTKIGSLRQFGLLERISDGRYKLSRTGLELALHGPSDPEYRAALRQAALNPKLFAELFREYGEASETTIKVHLIKDLGFSDDGAKKAARAFITTRDEAGITSDEGHAEPASGGDEDEDVPAAGTSPVASAHADGRPSPSPLSTRSGDRHVASSAESRSNAFNWLLADGVTAYVSFEGTVTPSALDMLIEYLGLMKRVLPRSAETMTETII